MVTLIIALAGLIVFQMYVNVCNHSMLKDLDRDIRKIEEDLRKKSNL